MEKSLEGKVAVVTGAGRYRGIGRSTALALARYGADVVVTGSGRPPDTFPEHEKEIGWRDVESVAKEIGATGQRALALEIDVSREDDAERLIDDTMGRFGRVDILVNNAAAGRGRDRALVAELELSAWQHVIDVNLTGPFLISRAFVRAVIAQGQGGSIVNVSSANGRKGVSGTAAYAAAKAGVILLTQVLALELAEHYVNVNCVCPGLTDTSRVEDIARGPGRSDALKAIPLARPGDPEEIANLIAFLCSPQARYIHGQAINVDGGQLMM